MVEKSSVYTHMVEVLKICEHIHENHIDELNPSNTLQMVVDITKTLTGE